MRLGTSADIARELGVGLHRVRAWQRRATAGFPAPVVRRTTTNGIPNARHYDLDAVAAWYATYRPYQAARKQHQAVQ